MRKKRVAINGFGRIGRAVARILLTKHKDEVDLIAINDPTNAETKLHLFEFDTNFGRFDGEISLEENNTFFNVNGDRIQNFSTRDISELPWGDLDIDIVLECTGVFRTKEGASKHLKQGAKKVLLSAPAKSEGFQTIVLGVNDEAIDHSLELYSNASCTTNCLAPVVKVLDENFGIISGQMTTIHSYTNDQRILDVGHKDLRRARSAACNIIPTTTGAAKAIGLVLPHLDGKFDGVSVRVPTPTVSLVDLVVKVKKGTTVEEVNGALKTASYSNPSILGYETRPLVSMDYKKDPRSSIVDADQTRVNDDLVKVMAWYDNEWGYSARLAELTIIL